MIRLGTDKQFCVKPLQEEVVTGEAHVAELLLRGNANRSTGRTDFNDTSSRSHSVFQLVRTLTSKAHGLTCSSDHRESHLVRIIRPVVCDEPTDAHRSGGERSRCQRRLTTSRGSLHQQKVRRPLSWPAADSPLSLLTLEKVISSLTSGKDGHVPYRESQLTRILQPSLSGAALVSVIATINPSPMAVEETKSTLKFAQRIKKVVLKAVVREVVDDKMLIHKYRSHVSPRAVHRVELTN